VKFEWQAASILPATSAKSPPRLQNVPRWLLRRRSSAIRCSEKKRMPSKPVGIPSPDQKARSGRARRNLEGPLQCFRKCEMINTGRGDSRTLWRARGKSDGAHDPSARMIWILQEWRVD